MLKKKTKEEEEEEEEERAMLRSIHLYGGFLLPFQILSFSFIVAFFYFIHENPRTTNVVVVAESPFNYHDGSFNVHERLK